MALWNVMGQILKRGELVEINQETCIFIEEKSVPYTNAHFMLLEKFMTFII